MTPEMWITLAVLVAAILLFVTEWLRVDVVAIGVVVALMVTNVLTTAEALSGFSNPAVLTIASLFVVGGAILQTGLAGLIGERILRVAGAQEARLIQVIMLAVALLSGFMSDTGTVAVLLPAIISLARSARISPSKLLIPLSYGALLGGAMTLIGTPPNIVVSDLLREQGLRPFEFFDYSPVGILLLIAGVLFMVTLGRRLLPDERSMPEVQRVSTPKELIDLYRLPENMYRLRVRGESELVGRTLQEARLGQDFDLSVLQVLRQRQPRAVAQFNLSGNAHDVIHPTASTVFQGDDILLVRGQPDDVRHAAATHNLGIQPIAAGDESSLVGQEVGIAEVVLPPRSTLLGRTLVETRFGSTYKLSVLSIQRPGVQGSLDLKETRLQFGDILLVQGTWENILALRRRPRDFVVVGQPEVGIAAPRRRKAPAALLILIGMLVLLVTNVVPVATASMLAALMIVLTGCLSMDDAYAAIDWKSIVLVAGMLPMSTALEKVGLVSLAAQGLAGSLGELGPLVVMASLFLLTSLFTQVLSNTATAVLVAPIALATAQRLGVQPYAFLMAVAIAASMAFASPVASPVNTLVMGAGSYRFSDYIKVGMPMILIMLVVSLLALPVLWPF